MNKKSPSHNDRRFLMRYAALGTQLLVGLGMSVFVGLKADKWLHTSPLLTCILPLLVLMSIFFKLYRETSQTKKNE